MCGYCGCGKPDANEHHHHHDQKIIQIEQDILAENQRYAEQNRQFFLSQHIKAFNLVSSPGAGKTSLLLEIIKKLQVQIPITVIEGDQQTDLDMQRIAKTHIPVLQINTGKTCHLDAHRISHALTDLNPPQKSILFIENVGNLVCPALFDLGEACKIVILSVTEGDDKPLKYPHMFAESKLMVINKMDLLEHVDFEVNECIEYAKRINPDIQVIKTSAKTGEGLSELCEWLSKTCVDHATFSA